MERNFLSITILCSLLLTTGCLDALTNSGNSGKFWGEDCEDVSEEVCPSGKAPDFSLVDQTGTPVNLTLYEGKVVVVSFVYTYCPDVCPALTYQLRKLSEELGDDYGESVEFITITVDPVRDTPERLASFAENNKADWRFLTSVSNDSFGDMVSIWADYRVYVDIDEEACSGNGHYMEGYDGCHCNPGFMQDSNDTYFGKDVCIADPNYSSLNVTFDQGSLEYDLILALEQFNEGGGVVSEEFTLQTIDTYLSQTFPSSWTLQGTGDLSHKSRDYYNNNLTLIEFFHTDCSVCNAQIPALKEFHSNFSEQVDVISIGGYSLSGNIDNMSKIETFASEHNVSWP
ncbi:MAG: SCO family protein, partial [Candidatus Thermoplasmatota archaeon]|nr:SCO family protein [Candidatus Thermoplasmatota archaeon]